MAHRSILAGSAGFLTVALLGALAGCGGGDSATPSSSSSAGAGRDLTVLAETTLRFDKPAYTALAGDISITYKNDGSLPHTLLIENHPEFAKLSIGSTAKGSVTLPAGSYTIYCDIAGHRAAGMQATLTVK